MQRDYDTQDLWNFLKYIYRYIEQIVQTVQLLFKPVTTIENIF